MEPVAYADAHAAPKEPLAFEAFLRQRVSVFAVRFKHSPHPNPPRGRGGSRGASPVHGGGWELIRVQHLGSLRGEQTRFFRPHPQPLSHSVGEGCGGAWRCALQRVPPLPPAGEGDKGGEGNTACLPVHACAGKNSPRFKDFVPNRCILTACTQGEPSRRAFRGSPRETGGT